MKPNLSAVPAAAAILLMVACAHSPSQPEAAKTVAPTPIPQSQTVELAGLWAFDRASSDPPPMRRDGPPQGGGRGQGGMGGGGRGGGGRGGGGMGAGGRSGGGGPGQGSGGKGQSGPPQDGEPRSKEGANPFMPAQMLDITQDEGTVTIAHDGGPAMVIVTDGEFIEQLGPRGPVLTRAGWRDGSLIIEHTNPDPNSQMRAIERYVRIADDDSLQVIITLQQDEDASPVTMRRVYRPAPVAAP